MTLEIARRLKQWARGFKAEVYAVYLACKDPRVPWYARILAACVVAYAFSPIDLIPDFIPVIGYLDDLVIVPLGIIVVLRLIPTEVMEECRAAALAAAEEGKPTNWVAAAIIFALWIVLAISVGVFILQRAGRW